MTKICRYVSELSELKKEHEILSPKDFSEKYGSHEFLIGDPACIDYLEQKIIEYKDERKR